MNTTTAQSPAATGSRSETRRILVGVGTGNAVEWFDWAIYATFASFIAQTLFSKQDQMSAFLATLAIFAVGFVARPFGGFLFGMIGDRMGRKKAMVLAIMLASIGSLLIAVTPSYESIGAGASIMLLVARLIQGLAHGGEMPSAQTYLAEMAPAEHRGFWSTLIYFSGTIGIVCGTLMGVLLTSMLSAEQMTSFGWRIPFLVGALLGLYSLVLRNGFHETEHFDQEQETGGPSIWAQMLQHWRKALQVIGMTVGFSVSFYVWAVSTPAYAIKALGMDATAALWAGVVANFVFIAVVPFWGKLSDRIGRRPVFLIACVGTALGHFPMSEMMGQSSFMLGMAMSIQLIFIAAALSILPAMYAEMFPTAIRTTGVAVPYSIAVALFGGTAAYLQAGLGQWFGAPTGTLMFSIYTIVLLAVSALTVWRLPETKGLDLKSFT